jgi:hypothetical protein
LAYGSLADHHDTVDPLLNAPQSPASVDLAWRDFLIFEVFLAIGAFSVNQLASLSLSEIEIFRV